MGLMVRKMGQLPQHLLPPFLHPTSVPLCKAPHLTSGRHHKWEGTDNFSAVEILERNFRLRKYRREKAYHSKLQEPRTPSQSMGYLSSVLKE
jgi:hypothetical protein